jgi:uncharacterized membrane protein
MALADALSSVVHLLFAGLWTGSVIFVAYGVLPTARAGEINAGPLAAITGKLTTVSRASSVVLFLTGGHLAGTGYTVESLTGSPRGHLVLAMVALWLVLTALVEVGAGTLRDGTGADKVRAPARNATRTFQAAALVALLLLLVAGALAGNLPAQL